MKSVKPIKNRKETKREIRGVDFHEFNTAHTIQDSHDQHFRPNTKAKYASEHFHVQPCFSAIMLRFMASSSSVGPFAAEVEWKSGMQCSSGINNYVKKLLAREFLYG